MNDSSSFFSSFFFFWFIYDYNLDTKETVFIKGRKKKRMQCMRYHDERNKNKRKKIVVYILPTMIMMMMTKYKTRLQHLHTNYLLYKCDYYGYRVIYISYKLYFFSERYTKHYNSNRMFGYASQY